MKGRHPLHHRLQLMQGGLASVVVLLLWLDEILDLPALFLGAPPTPINWRESLLESALVLLASALLLRKTRSLLQTLHYLEGFLSICSCCRKVRVGGERWISLEAFLAQEQAFRLSHGLCPACAQSRYGSWLSGPEQSPEPSSKRNPD